MLGEWAQAIQDCVKERDELRQQLALARGAKLVEEQLVRDVMREKAALRVENEQLRRELLDAQEAWQHASNELGACRARIRFLEKIAHETGHIIQLNTGGTR